MFKLLTRLMAWNLAPNGRHASFFNLWAGRRRNPIVFRAQVRQDLGAVFEFLARGELTAQITATYPLRDAAAALRRAEQGGLTGKIVLVA